MYIIPASSVSSTTINTIIQVLGPNPLITVGMLSS